MGAKSTEINKSKLLAAVEARRKTGRINLRCAESVAFVSAQDQEFYVGVAKRLKKVKRHVPGSFTRTHIPPFVTDSASMSNGTSLPPVIEGTESGMELAPR